MKLYSLNSAAVVIGKGHKFSDYSVYKERCFNEYTISLNFQNLN